MNANVNIQYVCHRGVGPLELSEKAKQALEKKELKVRVSRNGMFQWVTFKVRPARLGNIEYWELYTERVTGLSELEKIAEDIGLPASAPNGHAFPKGKGAADFERTDTPV
jgi:hypothetical protein